MRRRVAGLCGALAGAWMLVPAMAAASNPTAAISPLKLAVLPIDNRTGRAAPLEAVELLLVQELGDSGVPLAPVEDVRAFLERRRIRYTGGLSLEVLRAMHEELHVDAAVVTSADLWVEEAPPRFALNSRVVGATGGAILWADEVSLAGEERPGLLGLGEVSDASVLVVSAVAALRRSLAAGLVGVSPEAAAGPAAGTWPHPRPRRALRPQRVYRGAELDLPRDRPWTVAVLPFENQTPRDEAGTALAALFTTHLAGRDGFLVMEPGEIREAMLRNRVIQEFGLSLAQADALRVYLEVDLIVTGEILEYEDYGVEANPKVSFSVRVIDTERRLVVWSCLTTHRGDDGPTVFGTRRFRSAHALASAMVEASAHTLAGGRKGN